MRGRRARESRGRRKAGGETLSPFPLSTSPLSGPRPRLAVGRFPPPGSAATLPLSRRGDGGGGGVFFFPRGSVRCVAGRARPGKPLPLAACRGPVRPGGIWRCVPSFGLGYRSPWPCARRWSGTVCQTKTNGNNARREVTAKVMDRTHSKPTSTMANVCIPEVFPFNLQECSGASRDFTLKQSLKRIVSFGIPT